MYESNAELIGSSPLGAEFSYMPRPDSPLTSYFPYMQAPVEKPVRLHVSAGQQAAAPCSLSSL